MGWDEERETQLESIARFLGSTVIGVKTQALLLEYAGLLVRQGRYRAVAPDALAVLLASETWRLRSNEIASKLVPTLDREMLQELLGRAAELGRYEPSRVALENLLDPEGPFGTLDQIEEQQLGRFLIDLSIVSPARTLNHLARILEEIPIPELVKFTKSRRDTVWALEKLAWHGSTFEKAADLLLRLALAENETFANNATGTWVALFKAALPATAAAPEARLKYLRERAQRRCECSCAGGFGCELRPRFLRNSDGLGRSTSPALLRQAAHHAPAAVWTEIGTRLESGDWQISMTLRGWGTEGFPVELIAEWIGASRDRAIAVANIARAGDEQPTPLASWLLDDYGDVPEVASALAGEFMSGTWVGSWSSRLNSQIEQVKKWRSVGSPAVRRWCDEMIESLELDLENPLRREAEERW